MKYKGFIFWNGRAMVAYRAIKNSDTIKDLERMDKKFDRDISKIVDIPHTYSTIGNMHYWWRNPKKGYADKPGRKMMCFIGVDLFAKLYAESKPFEGNEEKYLDSKDRHSNPISVYNLIMNIAYRFHLAGWYVCNDGIRHAIAEKEKEEKATKV